MVNLQRLEGVKARFEAQLSDLCTVTEDATGDDNATLNTTTGEITGGGSDAVVSDEIPCLVRAMSANAATRNEQNMAIEMYELLMRADDDSPTVGAVVEITDSLNSPNLIGRTFKVRAVLPNSLNFGKIVRVQDEAQVPRLH